MLHTVEVGLFRGDVIAAMSNMMTWFDTRGSQPVIFRQIPGDATAFLVGFNSEADALAFVCAFGGRLIPSKSERSAA